MHEAVIDPRCLIDCYLNSVPEFIIKHHIDSFNQYVNDRIPTIIKQFNPYQVHVPDEAYNISVFVGGENGHELFFDRPVVYDDEGQTRLMTPQDAREMHVSYMFQLKANVLIRYAHVASGDIVEKTFDKVHIGSIPILLRSDLCVLKNTDEKQRHELRECPYDQGGYFIIDGKEKVIVTQEKIRDHKIFTHGDAQDEYRTFKIRCTSEDDRLFPKEHTFRVYHQRRKTITVSSTNTRKGAAVTNPQNEHVPVVIMLRALGVETDRDIVRLLFPDAIHDLDTGHTSFENVNSSAEIQTMVRACLKDAQYIRTQKQALHYLANLSPLGTTEHALYGLTNDFVPHAGKDFRCKALMLAEMIRTVMELSITNEVVDRDSMVNKRMDVTGFLLTYITRDFINRWRLGAIYGIVQEYLFGTWKSTGDISFLVNASNIGSIFSSTYIDKEMLANFKTNKRWAITKKPEDRDSIVQDFKRLSHLGSISHLRRVNTPIDKQTKIKDPHRLHNTHWGIICPTETPDGASIGLLKHLAITSFVSYDLGNQSITSILKRECGMEDLNAIWDKRCMKDRTKDTKVCLNNVWIGNLSKDDVDAVKVAHYLRLRRRCGQLGAMTSVSLDTSRRKLNIGTEQGRCVRPLLIVSNSRLIWAEKVKSKKDIKTFYDDWWKCVHPEGISAMSFSKDATGMDIDNGERAFENDKIIRKLESSSCIVEFIDVEESETSTLIAVTPKDINDRTTHCEIHPVAILGWVAANLPFAHTVPGARSLNACGQSKQSVGVFLSSFRRRLDTESYVMCYPQRAMVATTMAKYTNQLKLPAGTNLMVLVAPFSGYNQEDSLIVNKAAIERGALSITMYHTITQKEESSKRFYSPWGDSDDDENMARKRLMFDFSSIGKDGVIRPESRIYDKTALFCMRNGTVDCSVFADTTIGGRVDRVSITIDPVTKLRTASIVIREYRQLTVGDKQASRYYQKGVLGALVDECDMPFTSDGIVPDLVINPHSFPSRMTLGQLIESVLCTHCCEIGSPMNVVPLEQVPLPENKTGLTEFFSPLTGEKIGEPMFFGVVHYLRLKQQVSDKIAFRSYGMVDNICFQPVRGRAVEGGLRDGEMEMGSLIAHGVAAFLKESSINKSDGQMIPYDDDENEFPSKRSRNAAFSRCVCVPRAFDVMTHEFRGLGCDIKVETSLVE